MALTRDWRFYVCASASRRRRSVTGLQAETSRDAVIIAGLHRRERPLLRGCLPVDCIYEGEDQLYIHPDECIDCGACEPECPVTAIFPRKTPRSSGSRHREESDVFQGAHRRQASAQRLLTGVTVALQKSASTRLVASGCSSGARCPLPGSPPAAPRNRVGHHLATAGGTLGPRCRDHEGRHADRSHSGVESGRSRIARSARPSPAPTCAGHLRYCLTIRLLGRVVTATTAKQTLLSRARSEPASALAVVAVTTPAEQPKSSSSTRDGRRMSVRGWPGHSGLCATAGLDAAVGCDPRADLVVVGSEDQCRPPPSRR